MFQTTSRSLIVLLVVLALSTCSAFSSARPFAVDRTVSTQFKTTLAVSNSENNNNGNLEPTPEPTGVVQVQEPTELQVFFKQVQTINNRFWDYTCNFIYIGISGLILLNLCGYGYTFTKEDGLNIMPIETYRQERQWKEELAKSSQLSYPASSTISKMAVQNVLLEK